MEDINMDEDEDEESNDNEENKNKNILFKKEKSNGMDFDGITNPQIKRQIKKRKRVGYTHRRHSKKIMNFK